MSACQTQIDRLMGAISAQTGAEITRGKDGIYLFGSDRDEDMVMAVGQGADEGLIALQAVLGDIPADKDAGLARGLLQANVALAGMGWPIFALNGETNTVLCTLSLPRLDDQGRERDAEWLMAAMTAFLNAATQERDLVNTGGMRLPSDNRDGPITDDDAIMIRL